MSRHGLVRRAVGLLVATVLSFSVATPARAQFDPITMSLIMGAVQLAAGIGAAITLGMGQDGKQRGGVAMPYGTPCGIQDGVPQICWQPNAGGFEGSPDLPTGSKPFTTPRPAPAIPMLELEVKPVDPPSPVTGAPAAGQ